MKDKGHSGKREKGLWSKNTVVENRYEVFDLARGGMGEVYFVYDRETQRKMAVKTPLPSILSNEAGLKRFYREAEAWISLGVNPNVCAAYYVQEIDSIPRLFIEYVDGGSLDKLLKKHRLSTLQEKLDMAIQVASGMYGTHTHIWKDEEGVQHTGLVHRDLKPANILMSNYGMALITDFGLVGAGLGVGHDGPITGPIISEMHKDSLKLTDSVTGSFSEGSVFAKSLSSLSLTNDQQEGIIVSDSWQTITLGGVPFGTPQYMAPEQFKDAHTAGFPTDIYAYGCMLYEFFCCRRPFLLTEEQRRGVIFYQLTVWQKLHTETAPPHPAEFTPDIDEELAELMLQCLAKNPRRRPKDFSEIKDRLKAVYKRLIGEDYPRSDEDTEEYTEKLMLDSLNNQGVSYAMINQLQRAEAAWNQALEIRPNHPETAFNLMLYQCKRGLLPEDEAVGKMQEFIDNMPTYGSDRLYIGRFFMGKLALFFSNEHKALNTLLELTTLGTNNLEVYRDIGLLLCGVDTSAEDVVSWQTVKNSMHRLIRDGKEDPSVATGYALALKNLNEDYETFYDNSRERYGELPESLDEALHTVLPGFAITNRFSVEHSGITALALLSDIAADNSQVDPQMVVQTVQNIAPKKTAMIGCNDSRLFLVDLDTGNTATTLQGHTKGITALALSNNHRYALSASEDQSIALWDMGQARRLQTFTGHEGVITDVLFVGNSVYAVSSSMDGTIRAWDLRKGKGAGMFNTQNKPVHAIAISKDGKYVYSALKGAAPCKWDTKAGKFLLSCQGQFTGSTSIALSSDGKRLITGGIDDTVCLFDTDTGECISTFRGHWGKITSVAFSHDDRFALSTGQRTVHVRDLKNGLLYAQFKYKGPITGAVTSNREHQILFTQENELICLNYLNRYTCNYALVPPPSLRKGDIKFEFIRRISAARQYMDTGNHREALRLINSARDFSGYEDHEKVIELLTGIPLIYNHNSVRKAVKADDYSPLDGDGITALVLSYSGEHFFVAGTGGTVAKFDIEKKLTTYLYNSIDDDDKGKRGNFTGTVTALAVSYCNNYVFAGCDNGRIICCNADTGVSIVEFNRRYGDLCSMALTRGGQHLFSANTDNTDDTDDKSGIVRLWRTETGQYMGHFDPVYQPVRTIALSYNEKTVIAALEDGSLAFFDSVTGKERHRVEHKSVINAIALSPNGTLFLTACEDGSIGLWNYKTRTLQSRYDAYAEGATCVAFSPDGQYFASGSKDTTVALWSIHNQKRLQDLQGHKDAISAVVFSPDGWFLYSADMKSTVIKWFLNWTIDPAEGIAWKVQAKHMVSEFLSYQYRRGEIEKNKPSWTGEDLQVLESRFKAAGFGSAFAEMSAKELPEYQDKWTESVPKFHTLEMDDPKSKAQIDQEKHARTQKKKLSKSTAALVIILVVFVLTAYIYNLRRDRYDDSALSKFALVINNADRAREALDYVKGKSGDRCDVKELDMYKDSYVYMTRTHLTKIMSTPPRTQQYVSCLLVLSAGKDIQDDLIVQFSDGNDAETLAALSYLFSYAGNDFLNPLLVILTDPPRAWELAESAVDKSTRLRLVVEAIVNMGSTESVTAIIGHTLRDGINAEPIAPYIKRIIASKRLDVDAALKTIERLMNNESDEVRRNAVGTLELFKGSEAKRLAQKALRDGSEKVRKEAEKILSD
ncbi:MAG: protein kinase [Nitrospirae bacterium]|nr:protein kinase [Nitrospirota bacterium]